VIDAIVIRKEDPLVYSTGLEPTTVPEFDESALLPERDPEEVVGVVFEGPVAWTGKTTATGPNPIGLSWTAGCGCVDFHRGPVAVA
jgi:hypothetical protein